MANRSEKLSEAIGALRAARRVLLCALDDIGDASLQPAHQQKTFDAIHDAAIKVEYDLDQVIQTLQRYQNER